MDATAIRKSAQQARVDSEYQRDHSEYPGYGYSVHQDKETALEALADTLDEIGAEPPPFDPANAYASRKARRIWALKLKAARKRAESATLAAESHDMGSRRPLGQPLVGSPARRRAQARAIDRQNRKDDRACEAYREAQRLEERAEAAEKNRAISSDDPEALDKLRAKLASLEARRKAFKAKRNERLKLPILNYRAPDGIPAELGSQMTRLAQVEMTAEEYKRKKRAGMAASRVVPPGAHRVRDAMVGGCKLAAVFLTDSKEHPRPENESAPESVSAPPAWALTNLGAQIRAVKERIKRLEENAATPAEEDPLEDLPGCTVEDWGPERNRYALYSNDKPPQEITRQLRGLGLRWFRSERAWVAYRNNRGRYAITQGAKIYSAWWQAHVRA